jgi:hypothetical protein
MLCGTLAICPARRWQLPESIPLTLSAEALRPLISEIVREVVEQGTRLGNERLAYSESEAAALLGLNVHQLRDERLRGRIASSAIVGKRIRYLREDLLDYLQRGRTPAK